MSRLVFDINNRIEIAEKVLIFNDPHNWWRIKCECTERGYILTKEFHHIYDDRQSPTVYIIRKPSFNWEYIFKFLVPKKFWNAGDESKHGMLPLPKIIEDAIKYIRYDMSANPTLGGGAI